LTNRYLHKSILVIKLLCFIVVLTCKSLNSQVNIIKPSLSFGACTFPSVYHPLDNIIIIETVRDDFSSFGSDPKSLELTAPANFEFLPASGFAVVNGGGNLSIVSFTSTATTVTIEYNCIQVNQNDKMTIIGLEIRAINDASAGNITRTGGTGIISGCSIGQTLTTVLSSTDHTGNPDYYATVSYKTGYLNWSDPSSWECGSVPPNDGTAIVVVNAYQGAFSKSNAFLFNQDADVYSIDIEGGANFSPGEGGGKILTIQDDFNILASGNLRNLDLPLSGSNTIQIGGDFTSEGFMITDGASNAYNLTIEMMGTNPQSISGSGTLRMIGSGSGLSSLLINEVSDVTLSSGFRTTDDNGTPGEVIVNGTLRFADEFTVFSGSGGLTLSGYTELLAPAFNDHYLMTGAQLINSTSSIEFTNLNSVISATNIPTTTLGNLICNVSASGTLDLNENVVVTGTLIMQTGLINTNVTTLSIGSSTSNIGLLDYQGGTINGVLKRWFTGTNSGNASSLYPLSKNGTHKRFVKIEYTENTDGGSIKLEWINTAMGYNLNNDTISTNCNGAFTIENTDNGYWQMTPNDGITTSENKTYNITFDAEGIVSFADACHITALKRVSSGPWSASGTHQDNSGDVTSPVVSRLNSAGWSNWGFGGGSGSPLPVELSSFSSECTNNEVVISWTTESEYNSSHFELTKSRDGLNWETVHSEPAAGYSQSEIVYSFVDTENQDSYYRLNQYDIDGNMEIYGPIHSGCTDQNNYFTTYPNPSSGHFNLIINDSRFIGETKVDFCDVNGKITNTLNLTLKTGINLFVIDSTPYKSGLYLLRISNGNNFMVIKHQID